MTVVARRSVLYMPANNARALEKAKQLPADCIIIDLEDAVAPSAKEQARQQAIAAVAEGGFGRREVAIRMNGLGSPWFDEDLRQLADSTVQIVVLPKVEDAATVVMAADHLPESIQLWAMIETPRGVLNVESIAQAHPRLQVLVMGTSDLSKELRVTDRADRLGLLYSLERCVCAARAAGIEIIDGVQLDIADTNAFVAVCEQGKALGFDGKSLIHPSQINVANRIFAPSMAEIDKAERIVAAWQEALANGSGVAVLDGRLVENLHAAEAERIILLSKAINPTFNK